MDKKFDNTIPAFEALHTHQFFDLFLVELEKPILDICVAVISSLHEQSVLHFLVFAYPKKQTCES